MEKIEKITRAKTEELTNRLRCRNNTLPGNPEVRSMEQHFKYAKHFFRFPLTSCLEVEISATRQQPTRSGNQCTRLLGTSGLASFWLRRNAGIAGISLRRKLARQCTRFTEAPRRANFSSIRS
ncbi:MAG TPA: hypothetical protein VK165_08750 [Azonexus sp.]|nr:hypothetical protein [Azonexus sp.]